MPSPDPGLMVQAKRLAATARAKRDNEATAQAEGHLATALQNLSRALDDFQTAISSYATLRTANIAVAKPPDVAKPAESLRSHLADIGRPTPQFLRARTTDLARNTADLTKAVNDAWSTWTSTQLHSLPTDSIPVWGAKAAQVKDRINTLRGATFAKFSSTNLLLYKLGIDQIRDLIEELQQPPDPQDVLARIATGTVTLADLTDSELNHLRQDTDVASRVRLVLP